MCSMKSLLPVLVLASAAAAFAQPALTIYNGNFAVVREQIPLDLKAGENPVQYNGVTLLLEPDSVVLRDPSGKIALRVLEQSYRADTLSQGLLLSLHEGKTIDFLVRHPDGKEAIVRGKVIRSNYVPISSGGQRQQALGDWPGGAGSPIIEVDGKLRFSLPGEPLFPALTDDAILKPTLTWILGAQSSGKVDAELSYVTGGMRWEAAYNLVSPEKGDTLDVVGWVTIDNQSGKQFDNAVIKLMAGDVSKIVEQAPAYAMELRGAMAMAKQDAEVTEKAFDEFHLYSLPRQATLRNRETKQVEFLRAEGIKAATLYVYDGLALPRHMAGWPVEAIRNNVEYGTQSNPKVWVMREFKNSEENRLGLPLPKGRTRFYRRDDADGRLEFTGENVIDHTPRNEWVRIYTGDAFDIVGERTRTDFQMTLRQDEAQEAFEIKLRNRKSEPVQVRVVEHLYRGYNWRILEHSTEFVKKDAQTIEFTVTVPADQEVELRYRVLYDWK